MIQIGDKIKYVAIAIVVVILSIFIANPWIENSYNVGSFFFMILIAAAIWIIIHLITVYYKRTQLTRQEIIILVVIGVILTILILVMFKTNLVPKGFLGAVEGIQRFSAL